jgi:hypothetical protein
MGERRHSSALDGVEWSNSCPGSLTPENISTVYSAPHGPESRAQGFMSGNKVFSAIIGGWRKLHMEELKYLSSATPSV